MFLTLRVANVPFPSTRLLSILRTFPAIGIFGLLVFLRIPVRVGPRQRISVYIRVGVEAGEQPQRVTFPISSKTRVVVPVVVVVKPGLLVVALAGKS